jgi:hypothetical protein
VDGDRTSIASKVLQDMLEAGDFSVTMMPETGAMGGGVPIVHDGEIVGAIAASGDAVETDVIAAQGARGLRSPETGDQRRERRYGRLPEGQESIGDRW